MPDNAYFWATNVAQQGYTATTHSSVVRARIDERTKRQAAAALKKIGLTVSDAFRLLMVRVAAEKTLPFEPLNPNAETIAAMKAAAANSSRPENPKTCSAASMREIKYTTRFKGDYRREKSGQYGKKLDALLMEAVNFWGDVEKLLQSSCECTGPPPRCRDAASTLVNLAQLFAVLSGASASG